MTAERSAENDAPRFHSWQCMEAWMHPCRCGVDAPLPPAETCTCPREWITVGGGCQCVSPPASGVAS